MSAFVLSLGRMVATRGVAAVAQARPELNRFITTCLQRHRRGEWGDIDAHDIAVNDGAAVTGQRVLSVYELPDTIIDAHSDDCLWVITDAGHETTTVLWPSEY